MQSVQVQLAFMLLSTNSNKKTLIPQLFDEYSGINKRMFLTKKVRGRIIHGPWGNMN